MQDVRGCCDKFSVSGIAHINTEGYDLGCAVTRKVKRPVAGEGLPSWSTSKDFDFQCGRCGFHP